MFLISVVSGFYFALRQSDFKLSLCFIATRAPSLSIRFINAYLSSIVTALGEPETAFSDLTVPAGINRVSPAA